jgi:hypothetical protein
MESMRVCPSYFLSYSVDMSNIVEEMIEQLGGNIFSASHNSKIKVNAIYFRLDRDPMLIGSEPILAEFPGWKLIVPGTEDQFGNKLVKLQYIRCLHFDTNDWSK